MDTIISTTDPNFQPIYRQEPYLKLELSQQISAVLPMVNAREVLSIKRDRITIMPNMPDCIVGLLNQRSRIFWVIDLSQLLELSPVDRSCQEYNLVIIQTTRSSLGLIVSAIEGVTRFALEDIQSPVGNVAFGLIPYLQGCVLQEIERETDILLVLDAEAIINSPVLQTT